MAEQRPYRLPGLSVDARLARAKRLALLSLVGAFLAINWVTTQHAASVLRDASWLEHPLIHLKSGAIYAPWSWMVWWTRWYWAPQLEPLWRQSAREALYPMSVVTAVCCAAIAMVRHGWFANVSDLHGSARWATARDLRGARFDRRAQVHARTAARNRRLLSDSETKRPPRRNLSRPLAGMATSLVHPRLWPGARPGLCPNAERQGRGHRDSNAAQLAALGTGSRSQGGKLGAHRRSAETDGSALSQVRTRLSRKATAHITTRSPRSGCAHPTRSVMFATWCR
jgi:hypothetical protein